MIEHTSNYASYVCTLYTNHTEFHCVTIALWNLWNHIFSWIAEPVCVEFVLSMCKHVLNIFSNGWLKYHTVENTVLGIWECFTKYMYWEWCYRGIFILIISVSRTLVNRADPVCLLVLIQCRTDRCWNRSVSWLVNEHNEYNVIHWVVDLYVHVATSASFVLRCWFGE